MGTLVPDDLLEEILLRVPVRHLLRFKCVSKSWYALITECGFINKHYQIQYALRKADGDVPLLLSEIMGDVFFDRFDDPHRLLLLSKHQGQGDAVLNWTPNIHRDADSALVLAQCPIPLNSFTCAGVVNGLVWLVWEGEWEWKWKFHCSEIYMGLWNPATREFKLLPRWPSMPGDVSVEGQGDVSVEGHGFGFDPVTNDFKIVGSITSTTYLNDKRTEIKQYEMYSLSTNSWKRIGEPPLNLSLAYSQTDAYLNGLYYWAANETDREPIRSVILSFDFSKEIFEVFDPPVCGDVCAMASDYELYWKIALYMEHLAVFAGRHDSKEDTCSVDVWIVRNFDNDGECGVQLSWQHVLTIGHIPTSDGLWVDAFRMDGDLIVSLKREDPEGAGEEICNIYNPSIRTFKSLDILTKYIFRYVESLFVLSKGTIQN